MALNKSMHPRNRYKDKPPDFAYLASKYPDFKQHVNVNLAGKISLNFKDPCAVRALTCTLLKEDFGLSIDIPLERLIPTVPLRLNYIHWVEDLISYLGTDQTALRRGIDIAWPEWLTEPGGEMEVYILKFGPTSWEAELISQYIAVEGHRGTGASCIYPLLGATLNGWYFLATEVDDICFNYAKKNVEQNNLADLIKVVKVPQKTLLMDALKEESEIIYDFCMCNPPFFANQMEAQGVNSRNPHRPPPSSVNTGGITEIMAEGGELEFVKRIIHDSLQLKKRLRWYSCMLGKKCSLAPLKEELKIQGVPKVSHTEFYQGRTMRWALAWSFYDDVIIPAPPKKRKVEKPRKPMMFTVLGATVKMLQAKLPSSSEDPESIVVVAESIKKILTDLKVQHKNVPSGKEEESLFITAIENSWVHIRRKKRDQKRQLVELPRAPDGFLQASKKESTFHKEASKEAGQTPNEENSATVNITDTIPVPPNPDSTSTVFPIQPESMEEESSTSKADDAPLSHITEEDEQDFRENVNPSSSEGPSLAAQSQALPFLFKCLMNVKKEAPNVLVEMHWVEGCNRDLMNQLCTYLRNEICRLSTS